MSSTRRTAGAHASSGLAGYKRLVRDELAKLGRGASLLDLQSARNELIVSRAFRSSVHPRACAGLVMIASGRVDEKAASGLSLCCGQR